MREELLRLSLKIALAKEPKQLHPEAYLIVKELISVHGVESPMKARLIWFEQKEFIPKSL